VYDTVVLLLVVSTFCCWVELIGLKQLASFVSGCEWRGDVNGCHQYSC